MKYSWVKKGISLVVVMAMVIGGVVSLPVTANADGEFPSSFDLRDKGVVTPVKLQNPWQDCWSFSGTSAAETSILSLLGMTNEEYKAAYGENFDLSEKHLAWFAEQPITALTNPTQVGEGIHTFKADTNPHAVYDNGGFNVMVSTLFSSGVGPVLESFFPYRGKEGLTTLQYAEKYPVKAMPAVIEYAKTALFSERSFETVYNELKNPPYNAETQAMVDYLKTNGYLEGYPDPKDLTQEQFEQILYNFYLDQIRNKTGNSEYSALDDWTIPEANEQGNANRDVYSGFTLLDGNTLPDIVVKGADKKYQSTSQEGINAVKSELMKGHGVSLGFRGDTSKPGEVGTGKYINLETWAHYTYEDSQPTHAVCIVGWDDNYSATNFNDGHQPPANGAWIVKNSWGSETDYYVNESGATINKNNWGVKNAEGQHTGYFYLSYYDRSVMNPETVVFDTDFANVDGNFSVWAYDYMPSMVSPQEDTTIHTTMEIKTANLFKNDSDKPQRLYSVSTKTSAPNSTVNYSIYRVNDNTANPEEGTLLGQFSGTYEYEGFHREKLDGSIVIMPGETLSVVAEESAIIDGEKKYGCNVNSGIDAESSKATGGPSYCVSVVNPGESFYYNAGSWKDWTQVIPDLKAGVPDGEHYVIDNFSIKAYMVETNLDNAQTTDTVKVAKAPKTGDSLLDLLLQLYEAFS